MKAKYVLAICALAISLIGMSVKTPSKEMPATITALKLKPEAVQKMGAFSMKGVVNVDARGILKPASGNQIVYDKRRGNFLIFSKKAKYDAQKGLIIYVTGYDHITTMDSKDLGGGLTLNCNGCKDCKVVTIADGPKGTNYGCSQGVCPERGCFGHVNVPKGGVSEVMNQGGEWGPVR